MKLSPVADYEWIQTGAVPAVKCGSRWPRSRYFNKEYVEALCQLGGHIGTYIPYPWSSAARYVSAGETKEVPAPAAKVIHARVWRPQRQLRRQLQWLGLGLNPDKHAALIVQTSRRCVTEATVVLRIPCVMLVAMGPRCSRKFREYHERRMVEATTWSLYASFLRKKT